MRDRNGKQLEGTFDDYVERLRYDPAWAAARFPGPYPPVTNSAGQIVAVTTAGGQRWVEATWSEEFGAIVSSELLVRPGDPTIILGGPAGRGREGRAVTFDADGRAVLA